MHKKLIIPKDTRSFQPRPDLVLLSPGKKMVIVVELTIPWETRSQEAHELKSSIRNSCQNDGMDSTSW